MHITPAIKNAIYEAQICEQATGCPWELTVAQWALESGWGAACPGNNCFGIKCYIGQHGTQILTTHEYVHGQQITQKLPFATFATLGDCFVKHAELITQGIPYRKAWSTWKADPNRTPQSLARAIAPIYATDPTYADQLVAIMSDVTAALANIQPVQV
jgi:flagellar protein FlgJ